jgi:hypothetical protein
MLNFQSIGCEIEIDCPVNLTCLLSLTIHVLQDRVFVRRPNEPLLPNIDLANRYAMSLLSVSIPN